MKVGVVRNVLFTLEKREVGRRGLAVKIVNRLCQEFENKGRLRLLRSRDSRRFSYCFEAIFKKKGKLSG